MEGGRSALWHNRLGMANEIVTPFGFASTADDVVDRLDLSGKQVIVTGGASGIGLETTRALANAGAEVTLAVRNLDSGEKAAADIGATPGMRRGSGTLR